VVGQPHRLTTSPNAPDLGGTSITFSYLGRDVPPGEEQWLRVYFWDGASWKQLETTLDAYHNLVSAPVQGPGLYALISSIEIPLYGPGWNLFAYPVARPPHAVTETLCSLDGYYSTVYGYDAQDTTDPWKVYDVGVPDWVNDLEVLEFGQQYWISVTRAITLRLRGSSDWGMAADMGSAINLQLPPATFYGPVVPCTGFTPAVGMPVTASVGSYPCGQSETLEVGDQVVYTVNVFGDGPGGAAGCGTPGQPVTFEVASHVMAPAAVWDNARLWELALHKSVRADFVASPVTGVVPLTVTFTNTSTGEYAESRWDFGDTFTSTETNPTHVYMTSGTYTVTLTVSGIGGTDSETRAEYITVDDSVRAGSSGWPVAGTAPR